MKQHQYRISVEHVADADGNPVDTAALKPHFTAFVKELKKD